MDKNLRKKKSRRVQARVSLILHCSSSSPRPRPQVALGRTTLRCNLTGNPYHTLAGDIMMMISTSSLARQ